ncbi:MAG: amidohydrolase [Peptococcales bacterium]|jgi:amidohydrolase
MLEDKLLGFIDELWPEIWSTARYIYDNPELGGKEYKAVSCLKRVLEKYNFNYTSPYLNLDTAFRAQIGYGKPVICLLAEYDALPDIGHACGHHLIAGAAIGAAVALASLEEYWSGTLVVLGTPAEETIGAKVHLVDNGAFSNIDVALMFHPGQSAIIDISSQALEALEVTFTGFIGHSSQGDNKNPLISLINLFQQIFSYRRIHYPLRQIDGVITYGGITPNLIPEKAIGRFYLRSKTIELLEDTISDFREMALRSASLVDTKVEIERFEPRYLPMKTNGKLAEVFKKKAKMSGVKINDYYQYIIGSMDMGNVSQVVPAIHPFLPLGRGMFSAHSPEFKNIAGSIAGEKTMKQATKSLALTTLELFLKPNLVTEIWQEHFIK